MITLSLLHPIKQIPVQVWTFESESTIRIGRSTDNQVILYSAVVSRHHVELRRIGNSWEIVNLGTNGTYLDGKRITQVPVSDGAIIRLARSGPNIQIRIGTEALKDIPKSMQEDRTVQQHRTDYPTVSTEITGQNSSEDHGETSEPDTGAERKSSLSQGMIPVPPHLQIPVQEMVTEIPVSGIYGTSEPEPALPSPMRGSVATLTSSTPLCTHSHGGNLFCQDCGAPLRVLRTVGDYQLVQVLGQGEVGITYLAWRQGQLLSLKTLNTEWGNNAQAYAALECEADILHQMNHPQIPHLIDFFFDGHQPYLVMELMSGQSLAQRVGADSPVMIPQAIAWLIEICNVLEYIHNFTPPLLHRGIRPQNLILHNLTQNPASIALVDFGVIKSIILGRISTAGTTGYTAPEQFEINATPAVDLYALAPVFAYLITAQNPISFYSDRGDGYRFYADSFLNAPSELIQILNRLAHPDPEQRYSSARIVAEDLASLSLK
mgnify:CR=1 FL=1